MVQASLTDAQKAVAGVVDPSAIKQVTTTAEAAVSSAKPWVDQVCVEGGWHILTSAVTRHATTCGLLSVACVACVLEKVSLLACEEVGRSTTLTPLRTVAWRSL